MTRPEAMVIGFSGTAAEQAALAAISHGWRFWSSTEILASLAQPGTFLLYVGEAGSWQGLILAQRLDPIADLLWIYVAPPCRGQGHGERLLGALLERLGEIPSMETLMLEVAPSNAAAIRLYETFGLQLVGRRCQYYQNGEDALIYARSLRAC